MYLKISLNNTVEDLHRKFATTDIRWETRRFLPLAKAMVFK